MDTTSTFLPLIDLVDNFRITTSNEPVIPLLLHTPTPSAPQHPLGYLKPIIVDLLRADPINKWLGIGNSSSITYVAFPTELDTPEKRTEAVDQLVKGWIDKGLFSEQTGGRLWRNEHYTVYKDPFRPFVPSNVAFEIERTACALFGIVTYGVHMTLYLDPGDGKGYKIWVPTRAKTKQTWGGYLDNSVAGGIPSGLSPTEAIIKEAAEEASLDEQEVMRRIKSTGCVSYYNLTKHGWLQPEVQYVFDLHIPGIDPSFMEPRPSDGEVESFELCSVEQTKSKMMQKLFKPNCALVLVDFLMRHGYITPENEPNYLEIYTRMHGRFGYDPISIIGEGHNSS